MAVFTVPTNSTLHAAKSFIESSDYFGLSGVNAVLKFHERWMHTEPFALSRLAAWSSWCIENSLNIEIENLTRTADYIWRMGLFNYLPADYSPSRLEHEESGRFMPVKNVKNSEAIRTAIADISALLHMDHKPESLAAVQYGVSELLRNSLRSCLKTQNKGCFDYQPISLGKLVVNKKYPTDLTDSQWHHIKDFFPLPKPTGRPREVEFRQIVNAILYLIFTGCQWRFIPIDFPKWSTVYYYFAKWKRDGTWFRIHETLRAQERIRQKKNKHPTAAVADSQSVKTTALPSSRGFDGGKKINGRKRHILVDTLGLMITIIVTTACVQDRDGLKKLLRTFGLHRKKLRKVWVDGGYRGQVIEWVKARFRYCLEVVLRSDDLKGFVVLPKRWIVERTFAWLNNHRRLSKDYERFTKTSETMIQIAMIRLMLRRLQLL